MVTSNGGKGLLILVAMMATVEGRARGSNGSGDTICNSGGDKDSADGKELQG